MSKGAALQGTSLAEDLEDLYENAPCGYLSLSPDGLIVKVNQTFCEWTGFSKDQLLGRRLRDLNCKSTCITGGIHTWVHDLNVKCFTDGDT